MTVNELIKHLQELNGDVEIKVQYESDSGIYYDDIDSDNPIDSNEGIYFIRTECRIRYSHI